MYSYRVSGLRVLSEIELPGLIPGQVPAGEADVAIRQAVVPEGFDDVRAITGLTWEILDDRLLLRIPGIVRLLITAGRDIAFESEPGLTPADFAIFLSGTALGILLHQRGQIVLHASAVRVNDRAVLFLGPSGAGKSTLAAALGQCGYPLVTDDVASVTFDRAGAPRIEPDGMQVKLWAQAIDRLGMAARRGPPVRHRLEKYHMAPPGDAPAALPIAAVYALHEAKPPHRPGIDRPNVVDAARTLRRCAYRPLLVSRLGQQAAYFRAVATIAGHAGIFYLTRDLDFATLPEVTGQLARHWSAIGLAVAS